MRLFTKSLLASALVFAAAAPAFADPPRHYDNRYEGRYDHRYDRREDRRDWDRREDHRYWDRRDWNRHHWDRGDRFDRRAHYVVVNDYRRYHLRPPPRGHYYYRTDAGQILLVAAATGLIISAFNS